MSTEPAPGPVTLLPPHRPSDWPFSQNTLKRKFSSLFPPVRQRAVYPSPPMSSPPSPPGPPREISTNTTSAAPSTTAPAVSYLSGYSTAPPPPSFVPAPAYPGYGSYPSPFSAQYPYSHAPPAAGLSIGQPGPTVSGPSFTAEHGLTGQSHTRTGRKSKAHVASACINCKRAHLSCDVQRPCTRCVNSGKQDSCYDVQHKKRGRPRLREEGEFKVEKMLPEQVAGAAVAATTPRAIAGTRHRRTDSLRSLRSQGSDGSPGSNTMFSQQPTMQPPPAIQHSRPPSSGLSPAEVPTAYLDLDFVFIRANRPYQDIMCGGQDVRGRHLDDIAAPADGENFVDIRTRLRTEREAREPGYMPPIVQAGQDMLQGITEADVDRLSHTFSDQTYTWTRAQGHETFPARVRLARAAIYLVVVTLPSFRPLQHHHVPATPQYRPQSAVLPSPQIFTPRSTYQPPARRLPSFAERPATQAAMQLSSVINPTETEEGSSSSSKRRRVGIHDVLQK